MIMKIIVIHVKKNGKWKMENGNNKKFNIQI